MDARYWIETLGLARHPEGGWFRETYRSPEIMPLEVLPGRFTGSRCCSTAIYFLLDAGDVSKLHRIRSDELWHLYSGGPLHVHMILPDGTYRCETLGDGRFQCVVPAGAWFGAEAAGAYALAGCTVAPGFEFDDFEMGRRAWLQSRFPQHRSLIERLTD